MIWNIFGEHNLMVSCSFEENDATERILVDENGGH